MWSQEVLEEGAGRLTEGATLSMQPSVRWSLRWGDGCFSDAPGLGSPPISNSLPMFLEVSPVNIDFLSWTWLEFRLWSVIDVLFGENKYLFLFP